LYKPNFCCACGERVLRERWRAWTSRRFCPLCAKRFRKGWAAPFVTACALASTGFIVGRLMRPAPPPLTIERGALPLPSLLLKNASGQDARRNDGAAGDAQTSDGDSQARGGAVTRPVGASVAEDVTDPNEVIYICGARTKKGTPCQRRVRGAAVRCYQHKGMPAMLPPEKLIVRDKG
jgi:hypothetical protein